MRKLAVFSLAFAAGLVGVQYFLPRAWYLGAALLFLGAALGAFAFRGNTRLRVLLAALGLCSAIGYAAAYDAIVCAPAMQLVGREEVMTLELCEYARQTEYGARVTVALPESGLHHVKAVYYGDASLLSLAPGQRIIDSVEVKNAGEINGEKVTSFTANGAYLMLYSRGEPTLDGAAAHTLRYLPQHLAHRCAELLEAIYSDEALALAQALLLGDKDRITGELYVSLTEVSLYHITAVSGLHCGFILSLLTMLFGRERRRLLAAVSIPTLVLYTLMTGASPSVVRAAIMLSMLLFAPLVGRENDAITSLSFALFLILLENPYAIASVSLQLSFAAVLGMVLYSARLYRFFVRKDRPARRIVTIAAASVSTTLGAMVFTVPLCAYYFNLLSLIAPLSNLLCLWAVSLAFPLVLLSVLLGAVFLPLGQAIGFFARVLLLFVVLAARLLSKIPYHALYFSGMYLKFWLVYIYALFAACRLTAPARRKHFLAAALGASALALTLWCDAHTYHCNAMNLFALDVGQGESVLVTSGSSAALIDCGSSNSYIDAGSVAADTLGSMGLRTLDSVILTHYHTDHANGLENLFARVTINTLYLPDIEDENDWRERIEALAERYETDIVYLAETVHIPLGGAELTVYPPFGEGGANEEGLSVLCDAGDFEALITGDMDAATEKAMVSAVSLPDIEVLLVGHHGSAGSTSMELLRDTKPEVGIISVGTNSYGHPADSALMRLAAAKVDTYRTDRQGTVTVRVK